MKWLSPRKYWYSFGISLLVSPSFFMHFFKMESHLLYIMHRRCTWLFCFFVFRFKSDDERTPVNLIVDQTFPSLLNIFSKLVQITNPPVDVADYIKLICKIFWSSIYVSHYIDKFSYASDLDVTLAALTVLLLLVTAFYFINFTSKRKISAIKAYRNKWRSVNNEYFFICMKGG